MAQSTQYPSPTQAQLAEGAHPFYATQHHAPPEGIDINNSTHQGAPPPNNNAVEANIFASRDQQSSNPYRGDQHDPNQQLQPQVPPPQDPSLNPPRCQKDQNIPGLRSMPRQEGMSHIHFELSGGSLQPL